MFSRGSISILLGLFLITPILLLLVLKGLSKNWESDHFYRTWTDNTGQFSARARLKTDYGNSIVLERKEDGKLVTVPVARLSPGDRQFLVNGEEGGAYFAEGENEGPELFPLSFGRWDYSSPEDLWAVLVKITPLWVALAMPLGVVTFVYLLFLRSRTH